ncbi:MAG: hypothetical protein AAFU49_17980 [Pseudomonadota bacterium]
MIADIAARIAESIADPRRSVRGFLARGPYGADAIVGLIVGAYLVQAISAVAIPGARPETDESLFSIHVMGIISQAVICAASAGVVMAAGRVFGGIASFWDCFLAMSWYGFVTAFLSPLVLIGMAAVLRGDGGAGSSLLLLGGTSIAIWVFAGYVAEIHGFRSIGTVVAATIGFAVLSSMLLLSMMPPA